MNKTKILALATATLMLTGLGLADEINMELDHTLDDAEEELRGSSFSRDGLRYATGSRDNTLNIYDTTDFSIEHSATMPDSVRDVEFGDEYLALAIENDEDQVLNIGDWDSEEQFAPDSVTDSTSFSPDGEYFAFARDPSEAVVYDSNDFSEVATLDDITELPRTVTIGEEYAVVAGEESDIYVYSTEDWTLEQTLTEPDDWVLDTDISPEKNLLTAGLNEDQAIIYNTGDWSVEQTINDPESTVWSTEFSSEGDYVSLGTSSDTSEALVYDTDNWGLEDQRDDTDGTYTSVQWSPDDSTLGTTSSDSEAYIYDTNVGTAFAPEINVEFIESFTEGDDRAYVTEFSNDNSMVAVGAGSVIRVYGTEDGNLLHEQPTGGFGADSLAWSKNDRKLAVGKASEIRVFDTNTWNLEQVFDEGNSVVSLDFHPENKYLAGGDESDTIYIYNIDEGWTLEETITRPSTDVNSLDFSPDGEWLAGGDEELRVWSVGDWSFEVEMPVSSRAKGVEFSSDSEQLALADSGGVLEVYSVPEFALEHSDDSFEGFLEGIAWGFNDDFISIASRSPDEVILLDTADWEIEERLDEATDDVRDTDISNSGRYIIGGSDDENAYFYETDLGEKGLNIQKLESLEEAGSDIEDIEYQPVNDEKVAVGTGSTDGIVRIYDTESWTVENNLDGISGGINSMAYSEHNQQLAVGSNDENAYIYDMNDYSLEETLQEPASGVTVDFNANGEYLALAENFGGNDEILVYDTTGWDIEQILDDSGSDLEDIAFDPADSQYLSAGSRDSQNTYVWNTDTWSLEETLPAEGAVTSVDWDETATFLASGTRNENVNIYDRDAGFDIEGTLQDSDDNVESLEFSNDNRLAFGSGDTTTYIYDISTLTLEETIDRASSLVSGLGWSNDDNQLITGDNDGTATVFGTGLLTDTEPLPIDEEPDTELRDVILDDTDIEAVEFSRDGSMVAFDSASRVHIHDADTLEELQVLETGRFRIEDVSWSKDDELISAVESGRSEVYIWETTDWTEEHVIADDADADLLAGDFSPEGDYFATGGEDEKVQIYETEDWELVDEKFETTRWVNSIDWKPDNSMLGVTQIRGKSHFYSTGDWNHTTTVEEPSGTSEDGGFSQDGNFYGVATGEALAVYDTQSFDTVSRQVYELEGASFLDSISWSNDDSYVVVGGSGEQILVDSTNFNIQERLLDTFSSEDLHTSGDGQYIAVAEQEEGIYMYDTGFEIASINAVTGDATGITAESAEIEGTLESFEGMDEAEVWLQLRETGASNWERIGDKQTIGSPPETVTEEATDLEPDTQYEYRVFAENEEEGVTEASSEETFTTDDNTPPTVENMRFSEEDIRYGEEISFRADMFDAENGVNADTVEVQVFEDGDTLITDNPVNTEGDTFESTAFIPDDINAEYSAEVTFVEDTIGASTSSSEAGLDAPTFEVDRIDPETDDRVEVLEESFDTAELAVVGEGNEVSVELEYLLENSLSIDAEVELEGLLDSEADAFSSTTTSISPESQETDTVLADVPVGTRDPLGFNNLIENEPTSDFETYVYDSSVTIDTNMTSQDRIQVFAANDTDLSYFDERPADTAELDFVNADHNTDTEYDSEEGVVKGFVDTSSTSLEEGTHDFEYSYAVSSSSTGGSTGGGGFTIDESDDEDDLAATASLSSLTVDADFDSAGQDTILLTNFEPRSDVVELQIDDEGAGQYVDIETEIRVIEQEEDGFELFRSDQAGKKGTYELLSSEQGFTGSGFEIEIPVRYEIPTEEEVQQTLGSGELNVDVEARSEEGEIEDAFIELDTEATIFGNLQSTIQDAFDTESTLSQRHSVCLEPDASDGDVEDCEREVSFIAPSMSAAGIGFWAVIGGVLALFGRFVRNLYRGEYRWM